tara:strand:+ start:46 stop:300 length:255 start_codon:yes stop_codon:yes gene_type:complete
MAGASPFNFSLSGLINLVPTVLVMTGPITLPQKFPILILSVRKGSAKIIRDIQTVDQSVNHVKPKTNLKKNDNGPIFLFAPIKP